jgi:ubiquitin-activating enzyme E1
VFNDFGDGFEVLDKNGEELQDCMVKSITSEEEATVTLHDNTKHNLEDGDEIMLVNVEGMKLKPGEKQVDPAFKSDSINETIHKVKVINRFSFKIGKTNHFENYQMNGIAKQLRMKRVVKFRSFEDVLLKDPFKEDENLMFSFAEKMGQNIIVHIAFEALDTFKTKEGRMPRPWDMEDCSKFVSIAKQIAIRYEEKPDEWKADDFQLKLLHLFCF